MDKDLIAAIVGVLFAVFLGWTERRAKRKSAGKAPAPASHQQRRKVAVSAAHTSTKPRPASIRPVAVNPVPEVKTTAAARTGTPFLDSSSEGTPVTSPASAPIDTKPLPASNPEGELTAKQLRQAVVWSEILRRKF